MTPVLEHLLGARSPVSSVDVTYVRYRPGTRLLVRYDVQAEGEIHQAVALADVREDLAARTALPANAALVASVAGRVPARSPLAFIEELQALVQWPPLDVALPVVAEPPEQLRAHLVAAGLTTLGSGDLPRLLKYKPLSRAVFRLDSHVVKAHPSRSSLDRSVHALRAVASLRLRTAKLEAIVPEWNLEVQSLVAGARPASAFEAAPAAGALLYQLHRAVLSDLPVSRPADRLVENAEDVLLIATVAPALARRARRLLSRLEEQLPDEPLVNSHGGFHISQLLEDDQGRLGVIDFGGACLAPAALDVASYAASLARKPDDLAHACEALEAMCETYGSRPAAVPWYLSSLLLRRVRFPFTRFRSGWLESVDERLAAAEGALELR